MRSETILNGLAKLAEQNRSINQGDYRGPDGLMHCGTCGKAKEFKLPSGKKVVAMCDCESKAYEARRQKIIAQTRAANISSLKDASLMFGDNKKATFDRYKVTADNKNAYLAAQAYVKNFKELKKDGVGIVFYGPCGTGKTYTAACIANALLAQEISVVMTSITRLINDRSYGYEDRLARYLKSDLMILDDIGAESDTSTVRARAFDIINSRILTGKPLIVTTNITKDEMHNPSDVSMARIYDRLGDGNWSVFIDGASKRKGKAFKAQAQMRAMMEGLKSGTMDC